jgi:type II secretory pathway pseudopilin PulG
MKNRRNGFLLLEALMSLTLLVFGAAALMESLWISQQWMERGRLSHQIAMCLDQQAWLTLSNINLSPAACPDNTTVRSEAAPFSTSLVRVKWTASTVVGDTVHESSIEGFRSAL